MANAMYDAMWQEAMGDLSEQLNVEGAEDLDDDVNLEEVHEVWISFQSPLNFPLNLFFICM